MKKDKFPNEHDTDTTTSKPILDIRSALDFEGRDQTNEILEEEKVNVVTETIPNASKDHKGIIIS